MSKLKKIRVLSNMTQKEVSEELGISQAYFSMIENGSRKPSEKLKKKIIRLFHATEAIFG